jgi:hypothetical protein
VNEQVRKERTLSDEELGAIEFRVNGWLPTDPDYATEGMISQEIPLLISALRSTRNALRQQTGLVENARKVVEEGQSWSFFELEEARQILRALGEDK